MDKKTTLAVEVLGSGAAPSAGYSRGKITDIPALTQSIRQAIDCVTMAVDKKTVGTICLGISGSSLISLNSVGSVSPKIPSEFSRTDIDRACQAAVFAISQSDYEVLHVYPVKELLSGEGTALEVEAHIVTAHRPTLEDLKSALGELNIFVDSVVAGGVVAAEVMKGELPNKTADFLFIDIGAGTADIVLYKDKKICLSVSLPLGGEYITNDLIQGLSVSRSHAEEVKRYYARLSPDLRNQGVILDCNDYGTTDKHIPFDFLYDIIESRVDEIVGLVYDYLKPLIEQNCEKELEGIYLTGGCGAMPSMSGALAKVFKLPVEVVKPSLLANEYAHPDNTVCYGIMSYCIGRKMPCGLSDDHSTWNSIVRKAKKFLKI